MKPALFLYLLSGLFFFSCTKDLTALKLNPAGMKYIQLRPNQFFIYKDSASGKTDSVVVTKSVLTTETFNYTSLGSSSESSAKRQVYSLVLTGKGNGNDSIWLAGEAYADFDKVIVRLGWPEPYFVYPASETAYSYTIKNCSVEGTAYQDVIVLETITGNYFCGYYWAPGTGIIKLTRTPPFSTGNPSQTYWLTRHN